MKKAEYKFEYEVFTDINDLSKEDAGLLLAAKAETANAYAPYSKFLVAAVAQLANGQIVKGTNQENASYPVGICAERVLMSTASSLFPGMAIHTMAITYHNLNGLSNKPVSPCGMCRQAMAEFEDRTRQSIRLILGGMEGDIIIVQKARQLLPFNFGGEDLK
jgi:cytidine deaminase